MTDLPYADNVVKKIDLDHDGHPEILLGGGCIPLAYPLAHPTCLYRYAGGRLVRAAETALDSLGVIRDLTITGIDHDGGEDVLAVGAWSGILLLENKLGSLQPARNIYPGRTGLWNRIQITDIDNDGDQDLIVINDHIAGLGGGNALWRNDGPGDAPGAWRFTSVGAAAGVAIPANSGGEGVNGMGLAVGDVDHDGFPDLAFSNIGPNYLLLNNGDGSFRDVSAEMGMRRGLLACVLVVCAQDSDDEYSVGVFF